MMKRTTTLLAVLMLFIGMIPINAAQQPFIYAKGELQTSNFDPWGGVNGTIYTAVPFNVDAAGIGNVGLTMYVYGLNMSSVHYEGGWIWPPDPSDLGAIADVGVTGDTTLQFDMKNAAWFQLHSSCGTGGGTWNYQSGNYNHTTGVRKWLIQGWNRGLTGGKVFPDDPTTQYNIERFVPNTPNWGSVYMPGYNSAFDEYQTFDFKIQYIPLGGGQYKMQGWIRMHAAPSWDEMWYLNWPFKWQWNKAMNNVANPEDAWLKIGGHQPDGGERIISDCNFSMVYPYVEIANWGTTQTQYHVISWERVVIEGTPATPPPEMWVDDNWAGLPNGTEAQPGKFISYNAFALIQDAINAADPGTLIWVYDGTYSENLVINKALTIQVASHPIIDGGAAGNCISVSANNVVVNGFEIRNGYNGISGQTSGSTFSNNVIHDNLNIPGSAGVGILLWGDNDNNIITGNTIFDNDRQGIFIGYYDTTYISTGNIISYNTIYSNGLYRYANGPDASDYGIQLWTADNNVIEYNEIYGHDDWFPWGGTFDFAQGIYLCDSDSNLVTHNYLHGNNYGVGLWHPSRLAVTNTINYNNIAGNTGYGVCTFDGPPAVDARFNWWSDASGPTHLSNTGGTGDAISDNVDYSPWLGATFETTPRTYHVNPTGAPRAIQEAVDEASSGDTIIVHDGTYNEALYINKNLVIKAASTPVITGGQLRATNYGNRQATIFVEDASNVVLQGLDVEGQGLGVPGGTKSYAVLYENSSGTVQNCTVSSNTVGDMYSAAIAAWDNSDLTIKDCMIKNFGRIGVYSNNATMSIEGNRIVGQVYNQDYLVNYGIEIEDYSGPSIANISQNVIYNCNNTSLNPLWSSAAIIVDTWREWADYYQLTLLPSNVSITFNEIYDNYESIEIVASELSSAHHNNFHNNTYGVWSAPENWTTNPTYYIFDARYNWWGSQTGPYHSTLNPTGLGDMASDYVNFIPWLQVIHDVAVIDVAVSPTTVVAGQTVTINVTVKNEGSDYENFTVTAYYDGTAIASQNVTNLLPNWNTTLTFYWNTTGMARGNYTIKAVAGTVPSEVNTANNVFTDGEVQVLWRDVAVTSVSADHTWVYQGFSANINVTVLNNGDFPETVAVTLYYNITANKIIGTQNVALLVGESKTLTFVWNTAGVEYCHNYTITAVATIPLDNNPADNTLPDGRIKVRILGDTNGDGKVDIKDILAAAKAFGETPDRPNWDPNMDLNNDGKVNIKDILIIAKNYGKNCSP
jgi:parallel beta-helix repeat protein